MLITSGKIAHAQRVCLYGPEGIGKSTFASKFPCPIFCDTEGSTRHMDVSRTPSPTSWAALMEQVKHFIQHPDMLGTFVLDTADWAERLCVDAVCAKGQKTSIEDFGYGKGYVYLVEEFGKLLDLLTELTTKGIHVVILAHAKMRKFEQPDELGAYDRWEMKLSKNVGPLVKEWADMVLFASYKTIVVNVDNQGAAKGKNKVQGGQRVMRTTHHACWDAKNRHDLPDEMPLDYAKIAHLFNAVNSQPPELTTVQPKPEKPSQPPVAPPTEPATRAVEAPPSSPPAATADDDSTGDVIPQALNDLMIANGIKATEVRYIVQKKGYFPSGTLIKDYGDEFVNGWLVGLWPQVYNAILNERQNLPF